MKLHETMTFYSIYVSRTNAEGRLRENSSLQWMWRVLDDLAQGYTICPAGDGLWVSDGVQARHPVLLIQAVLPASQQTADRMAEFIRHRATVLDRQAIFLSGVPVSASACIAGTSVPICGTADQAPYGCPHMRGESTADRAPVVCHHGKEVKSEG